MGDPEFQSFEDLSSRITDLATYKLCLKQAAQGDGQHHLKTMRQDLRLTVKEAAGLLDVAPSSVSSWETGYRMIGAAELYKTVQLYSEMMKARSDG